MSEGHGSQHGNVPPIPENSYLAWWLLADQAQQDADQAQQEITGEKTSD